MTGREVAIREAGGGALQPELAAAGVQIREDESGRYRSIEFPEALKQKFNILLPVAEVVQADPNYTPSIRAANLQPTDSYFYNQGTQSNPRWAPLKQALEVLADLAGVQLATVRPLSMLDLAPYPEGSFGYSATITIRRSDGTPRTITRSRIWNADVEREKIIAQVAKADGKSDDWKQAEFRRRWLQEREHGPAKTESKAVLRAIRAALQIPHTFSAADAKKPFVVVGYSFTPDYSDPEVRRLVIERGLSAGEQVFGSQPAAGPLPETGGEDGAAPDGADTAAPSGEGADPQPAAPSPAFEGEEPAVEPEPEKEPEPAQLDEADFVLPAQFTRYAGKTLAEIDSDEYLAWLASDAVKDEPTRAAAKAFVAARAKTKGRKKS